MKHPPWHYAAEISIAASPCIDHLGLLLFGELSYLIDILKLLDVVTGILQSLDVWVRNDGMNDEAGFFASPGSMIQNLYLVFAHQIGHGLTALTGDRDVRPWHRTKPPISSSFLSANLRGDRRRAFVSGESRAGFGFCRPELDVRKLPVFELILAVRSVRCIGHCLKTQTALLLEPLRIWLYFQVY